MNFSKENSVTLTELMVATVIVGVIMLGVTGIDIALRSSHLGTTRTGLVAMRTAAIMSHMAKTIRQATGFGDGADVNDDPGILVNFPPGFPVSLIQPPPPVSPLWIRIDDHPVPTPDFNDDSWFCYDYSGNTLRYCKVPDTNTTCDGALPAPPLEVLGPAVNILVDHVRQDNPPNPPEFYVQITITNRFDPSAPRSLNSNPEYQLTTQVETPMHSY